MKRLITILAVALAVFSCNREDPVILVDSVTLNPAELTLKVGEQQFISATVAPVGAADKELVWSSSNPAVASIDNGRVTALSKGTAAVTARAVDGSGRSATCQVTVKRAGPAIVLVSGQTKDIVFDQAGGETVIRFSAEENWTAAAINTRADAWLSVSPASGSAGAAEVKVTAAENAGVDDRFATVQLTSDGETETVTVTQKQKDALTVSSTRLEVEAAGGQVSVTVKANIDFSYTLSPDCASWLKPVDTKSYDTHMLFFSAAPNEKVTPREGSIVISGSALSETVKVYQDGAAPSLVLTRQEFEVGQEGGELVVEVKSNVDVTMTIPPGVDWIREQEPQSTGTFRLTVDPNTALEDRTAEISFSGGGLTEKVQVTQARLVPYLTLEKKEFELGQEGGEVAVEVKSNVDVTMTIPPGVDWIREQEPQSTGTFRLTVDPNTTPDGRETAVAFSGGGLSESVKIVQKQQDRLTLSPTEVSVPQDGGTFEVSLSSNVDYEIYVSSSWVREVKTKALSDRVHTFEADALPVSMAERSLEIRFSASGSTLGGVVTVTQREESVAISFADPAVKAICVSQWDRNGDGELSEREAEAVTSLGRAFYQNSQITSFDELAYFTGLTQIGSSAFRGCSSLQHLILPGQITSIGSSAFYQCSALTELVVPAGVTEIGYWAFGYCSALQSLEILAVTPPQAGSYFLYETGNCPIYVPEGTVPAYKEAEYWTGHSGRVTCRGHQPSEYYYRSTDYSADGQIIRLQEASVGRGINLIFLGDGFVDTDLVPGGLFETQARAYMEQFFVYEPYKTFRARFNVWCVKVVSANKEFSSTEADRRLTEDKEDGSIVTHTDIIREYTQKVPNPEGLPYTTAVLTNVKESLGRSWCTITTNSIALIVEPLEGRPSVINHEMGGHGFASLADEYEEYSGTYPDKDKLDERYEKYGWYANIDWRNDPKTVRWAHLLADTRYGGEGLGIFEGAAQYPKGVYRATENSMMRSDTDRGAVFNAPSREQIYKMIMTISEGDEWTYDYETFVQADEAGRKQAADGYAGAVIGRSRAVRSRDAGGPALKPDLKPIVADDSVRSITVGPDGRVTLHY